MCPMSSSDSEKMSWNSEISDQYFSFVSGGQETFRLLRRNCIFDLACCFGPGIFPVIGVLAVEIALHSCFEREAISS